MNFFDSKYHVEDILKALDICGDLSHLVGCYKCPLFNPDDNTTLCRFHLMQMARSIIYDFMYGEEEAYDARYD